MGNADAQSAGAIAMDLPVPYMPSRKNLHAILDAVRRAAVPEQFSHSFLNDLGYNSSNDRPVMKLLRYIGFLDASNRPTDSYREFMNQAEAKRVLARRIRVAYDDLFKSNKGAQEKSVTELKGWFKSKTGEGDSVAEKVATTFKALSEYADFSGTDSAGSGSDEIPLIDKRREGAAGRGVGEDGDGRDLPPPLSLVYRVEVHLPDTQNLETYRAIFRAMREELGQQ